jgi:hypothetical protein
MLKYYQYLNFQTKSCVMSRAIFENLYMVCWRGYYITLCYRMFLSTILYDVIRRLLTAFPWYQSYTVRSSKEETGKRAWSRNNISRVSLR